MSQHPLALEIVTLVAAMAPPMNLNMVAEVENGAAPHRLRRDR